MHGLFNICPISSARVSQIGRFIGFCHVRFADMDSVLVRNQWYTVKQSETLLGMQPCPVLHADATYDRTVNANCDYWTRRPSMLKSVTPFDAYLQCRSLLHRRTWAATMQSQG